MHSNPWGPESYTTTQTQTQQVLELCKLAYFSSSGLACVCTRTRGLYTWCVSVWWWCRIAAQVEYIGKPRERPAEEDALPAATTDHPNSREDGGLLGGGRLPRRLDRVGHG